jgi:transcriptional regulator with XRE-family HTH domain
MGNYDPAEFWTRYQALSGKDLPVTIKTGIKQSTLSTWRTQKIYPRADDAVKIAETLQTTVEYLVTGSDKSLSSLDSATAEISQTAAILNDEGKHIALAVIKGLVAQYHQTK